jgi:hypothetical protein
MFSFAEQNSACVGIENVFAWKIWHEMSGDADRSHTRTAAAVWNAKGFVQVQVANVGTVITGSTETDLRVHVCAVHVNLAAMRMNNPANFANGRLEYAVGRRVRDHQRGKIPGVLVRFCAKVCKVDIAIF